MAVATGSFSIKLSKTRLGVTFFFKLPKVILISFKMFRISAVDSILENS